MRKCPYGEETSRGRVPAREHRPERCTHPDGCPNPHYGNGLCVMHNARVKRTGILGPAALTGGHRIEISPGDSFDRWVALESYSLENRNVLCRCECGTERRVLGKKLVGGKTHSCGCAPQKPRARRVPAAPYIQAGAIFGRLTAIEDATYSSDDIRCRCECGTETVKTAVTLKFRTRSCGCLKRERMETHGLTGHPLFPTWRNMISRTTNPADSAYANYGGRGITVCERWQGAPDGFLNFVADVGVRPKGCSLDRINNDGNYEPENVRWATAKEQMNNRRTIAQLTRERDALAAKVAELEARLIVAEAEVTTLRHRARKSTALAQDQAALF